VNAASGDVTIIDSGGANLASLQFALERLGASSVVSSDASVIRAAHKVLLPGVGAAANAMARLRAAGLDQTIPQLHQPLLGICLGMQLLFAGSEEGDTACLGVIDGRVRRIAGSSELPVPHMGWNNFSIRREDPLLRGFGAEDYVYFVHGYAAATGEHTLASTDYGAPFSAIVRRDNFWGVQFHPERSAAAGARLLKNFLEL
jgi:glutamine amidotransferase